MVTEARKTIVLENVTIVKTTGEWQQRVKGFTRLTLEVRTTDAARWAELMGLEGAMVGLASLRLHDGAQPPNDSGPGTSEKAEPAKQAPTRPEQPVATAPKAQQAPVQTPEKTPAKKSPGLGNNRPDNARSACGWWDQLDDEGAPVRLVYCKVVQGHTEQHMWARAVPSIPST